jgi:hypothetical protein
MPVHLAGGQTCVRGHVLRVASDHFRVLCMLILICIISSSIISLTAYFVQGYRILLNIQYLSPSLGDSSAIRGQALPGSSPSTTRRNGSGNVAAFTTHIDNGGWAEETRDGDGVGESYEMLSRPISSSSRRRG